MARTGLKAALPRELTGWCDVTSPERRDVHAELDRELGRHPAAELLAGHAAVHHDGDRQAVDERGEAGHGRRGVRRR